jgi:hypothetical protein
MENILGPWAQPIGYLTLGILFFLVVWGMTEEIARDLFSSKLAGQLLALLIATYGFWYPIWQPMRVLYIVLLSFAALVGTALSRFGVLARWTGHGRYALTLSALVLVILEIGQLIMTVILKAIPSLVLTADLISWGLLIYGISGEVTKNLIGPVISEMSLPRTGFVQAAFVLASVVFLPIEFPVIDGLMAVTGVLATLVGWYWLAKRFA